MTFAYLKVLAREFENREIVKLVYIHQYFWLPSERGGSRPYEQAARLAAAGHEVHVISRHPDPYQDRRWTHKEVEGFHLHRYPNDYNQNMSHSKRISAFIRFALAASAKARSLNGDLVFASSTPLTVAIPGILASSFPRKPFIFEVRDLWPDLPIAFGALQNPIARRLARLLETFAYRRAQHIIALSPDMKERIQELTYPTKRITVIPNASDVEKFAVSPNRAQHWLEKHPELPTGRPLVTYAGSFGEANRVDFFVDVAKHLKNIGSDAIVLLIGDGKEKSRVVDAAKNSGCYRENLFILDPVAKETVPLIYKSSTIILSSLAPMKELGSSSPNKVFDAFAAGRPVAINYGGWLAEIISRKGAGFTTDFDANRFARSLDYLLNDEEGLSRASVASADLGRGEFNRDRLVSTLIEIIFDEESAFTARN